MGYERECYAAVMRGLEHHIKQKFNYLPSKLKGVAIAKSPVFAIDTGLKTDMFNIAFCNGPTTEEDVHATIAHFKKRKLPFAFWVGFDGDPPWIEVTLQEAGYRPNEDETLMVTNLDFLDLPDEYPLEIREVKDQKGFADFLSVLGGLLDKGEFAEVKRFYEGVSKVVLGGTCKEHFFVGYQDGEAIGCASSFCHDDLASIFNVIVLEKWRGQGFGKALTLCAMRDAKRRGMSTCHLTATDDAKHLYSKLSFKEIKLLKVYSVD